MEVSVDELIAIIGRLTVENQALRGQLAQQMRANGAKAPTVEELTEVAQITEDEQH